MKKRRPTKLAKTETNLKRSQPQENVWAGRKSEGSGERRWANAKEKKAAEELGTGWWQNLKHFKGS